MERFDVALLGAIVAIVAFTETWKWILRWFRTLEYEKQKRLDRDLAKLEPPVANAPAFKAASDWLRPLHERSIAKQNAYYDCLTRSVSALSLALLVLILGVTFLSGQHWFSMFSAATEVLAFLYVLVQFTMGRRANKEWIEARTESEIVRQAGVLIATGAVAKNEPEISEDDKGKWERIARQPHQGLKPKEELSEKVHDECDRPPRGGPGSMLVEQRLLC